MSIFEQVPMRQKGCRYFLNVGAATKFNRGWRTRAEVDAWMAELRPVPFWRVGYLFDVGAGAPCRIVNRMGEELKP